MRYRMALFGLHIATLAPACGRISSSNATPPSKADAIGLVQTYAGACGGPASAPNDDFNDPLRKLMRGCSEIPSCAGTCAASLHKGSDIASSSKENDQALMECFPEFKRDHEQNGLTRRAFGFRLVSDYADRVLEAKVLDAEGEQHLRQMRAKCPTP